MKLRRLAPLVVLVGVVVTCAGPASAVDLPGVGGIADTATCKAAPDPSTPDGGMAGFLIDAPPNPESGDPWDPNSGTTLREKYGYGGLKFVTYDQGCMGQASSAGPNMVENLLMSAPIFMAALSEQVMLTMVNPTFLGVFDPVIENASRALHGGPFRIFIVVTILAVGLWVIVKAFRRSVTAALSAGLWALLIVGMAGFLASSPLVGVRFFDQQAASVSTAVASGFGSSSTLSDQVHREILFRTWLAGSFGDARAPVADRYGRELFEASVYSWAEWQGMRANPGTAGDVKKAKQSKWQEVAQRIKDEDPVAYEHLQGRHINDRITRSLLASLGVLGATLFQIIAGMGYVVALLTVRFIILAFPIAAILGAFPTKRLAVLHLWQRLLQAAVAAVACQVAAGLVALFVGAVLAATMLAGWLVYFMLMGIFIAAWVMLRPYRSFAGGQMGAAGARVVNKAINAAIAYASAKEGTQDGVQAATKKMPRPRPVPIAPPAPTKRTARTRGAEEPNWDDLPLGDPVGYTAGFTHERESSAPLRLGKAPRPEQAPEQASLGRAASTAWRGYRPPPRQDGPDLRKHPKAEREPVYDRHGDEAIDMQPRKGKDGEVVYTPVRKRKVAS